MKTASEIAKELKTEVHRVRYALTVLRQEGKVGGALYGNTRIYNDEVSGQVKKFFKRKRKLIKIC